MDCGRQWRQGHLENWQHGNEIRLLQQHFRPDQRMHQHDLVIVIGSEVVYCGYSRGWMQHLNGLLERMLEWPLQYCVDWTADEKE